MFLGIWKGEIYLRKGSEESSLGDISFLIEKVGAHSSFG
jgi:hypothetical protein